MTATTVPTAPLPSLDLAKYEGHTPGPWSDDGDARSWSEEYGYARSWVDTPAGRWTQEQPATGNDMARQMIDAKLIADAPQLLAALLTMQRERDAALVKLCDPGTTHYEGCHADGPKHWQCALEKLAASERTCAELRDSLLAAMALEETYRKRAEAAERTVEGRMAIAERVYHSALGSADVRFRIALEAALSATKEE